MPRIIGRERIEVEHPEWLARRPDGDRCFGHATVSHGEGRFDPFRVVHATAIGCKHSGIYEVEGFWYCGRHVGSGINARLRADEINKNVNPVRTLRKDKVAFLKAVFPGLRDDQANGIIDGLATVERESLDAALYILEGKK